MYTRRCRVVLWVCMRGVVVWVCMRGVVVWVCMRGVVVWVCMSCWLDFGFHSFNIAYC